ncbi:very short patch repair endonuclease [Micromonospora chalcea]|uniref:very short patch repair endonuclease n=1 Tax=Micromonospora chalcea TaxID=1874 RepID=UPI002882DC2A|nr:very short patch repair endonuclease [Micromonospora chalcea]
MATRLPVPASSGVSRRMSRQRRKDTAPEVSIRRLLHARGYRYRVAWPVPAMPRRSIDIAFTRLRIAVFIDGCFWHSCPEHRTKPASNSDWWSEKLKANQIRDSETNAHLAGMGWSVIRIWEHEDPTEAVEAILSQHRRALQTSRNVQQPMTSR